MLNIRVQCQYCRHTYHYYQRIIPVSIGSLYKVVFVFDFSFYSMLEQISIYWMKTKILRYMSNVMVNTKNQLRLHVSRNWYVIMSPGFQSFEKRQMNFEEDERQHSCWVQCRGYNWIIGLR